VHRLDRGYPCRPESSLWWWLGWRPSPNNCPFPSSASFTPFLGKFAAVPNQTPKGCLSRAPRHSCSVSHQVVVPAGLGEKRCSTCGDRPTRSLHCAAHGTTPVNTAGTTRCFPATACGRKPAQSRHGNPERLGEPSQIWRVHHSASSPDASDGSALPYQIACSCDARRCLCSTPGCIVPVRHFPVNNG